MIAGHRRLAAAKDAELKTVPCTVLDGADAESVEILAVVENLQRENLHPLDEADGFARLETMGMTRTAIAEQVGCHRNHVAARMRLTALCPEVRTAWIEAPTLTIQAAEAIALMTPEMQVQYVERQEKRHGDGGIKYAHEYDASEWARSRSNLLTDAPWDIADADLVPAAGPCATCPKRFDYQPDMFAEDAEAPEARCGDRKCWNGKLKTHVDQARQRATENGVELTDVTLGARKGAVPSHRVERYDQEKHANRKRKPKALLIVDGPEAGTVVDGYVKPARDPYAAEERKRAKERAQRQARNADRLETLRSIAEAIESHPSPIDVLTAPRVVSHLAYLLWSWPAERAAAVHLEGAETNEYGALVDQETGNAARAKVADMDPVRAVIYTLAAANTLLSSDEDDGTMVLLGEVLGVVEAAPEAAPADAEATAAPDADTAADPDAPPENPS